MKHTLLCIFLAFCAVALSSAKGKDLLQFDNTKYDFGIVDENHGPVVHEYKFVNTADEPVAVLSVNTGCGCTRPEYPVKPLDPGQQGVIKITFEPKGQDGSINKSITVRYRSATARSSKRVTLRLSGTVKK